MECDFDPIKVALHKSKMVIFEDITKILTFIFLNPTLGSTLNKIKFLTHDMIFSTLLSKLVIWHHVLANNSKSPVRIIF